MAVIAMFAPFTQTCALENIAGVTLLPKNANSTITGNIAPLPIPDDKDPNKLSLINAVLLALRRNPNLKEDFNNRKVSRYALLTAQQAFRPQFGFSSTYAYTKNKDGTSSDDVSRKTFIGPTVSWGLPTGTVIKGDYGYSPGSQTGDNASNTRSRNWDISITQQLLKGFGWDANMAALRNAHSDQTKADDTLEQNVITTITQVMTDYYAVVQAKETIKIDKSSLKDALETFEQRKALFQAGRVSESDLSQAELTSTQKRTTLAGDEQKFNLAREKLMNDLGLPNSTNFHVDNSVPVQRINPTLKDSLKKAVKNNLGLKIAKIGYIEAKRSLATSENNQLPSLSVEYKDSRSNTTQTTTTGSTKTVGDTSVVSVNLSVPLDRVSIDQKSLQSAITMQNEQISFHNTKMQLKNSVITSIQNLRSQWDQIETDKVNLRLAENNYKAAQVKYQYGKINAFTLAQQQEQLQTTQNSVVNDKISYLQAVTSYEKLVGTVLQIWHIHLEGMKNATQI